MTDENSAPADNELQGTGGPGQDTIPGAILRAHDGTLYFIPDHALATFRVTSSMGKAAVQDKFEAINSGNDAAPRLEAYHVQLPDTLFGHSEIFR